MINKKCNVCNVELGKPVYSNDSGVSITSLCEIVSGKTTVFYCDTCTHLQTTEIDDIEQFYDKDYKLLVDSEEEDQIYSVEGNEKVFRYDHQVSTLVKLVNIPKGANILDYGCAKGTTLKKLAEVRDDITPYLFDVSDMYVPFWNKFASPDCWATYSSKSKWKNQMDLVTSFFSLEHVASPKKMLSTIWELLKENGYFYCIVPNVMENIADFVVVDHVNHFTNLSITRLMSDSGFEVLDVNTLDHVAAMIIVARKVSDSHPEKLTGSAFGSSEDEDIVQKVTGMADYWRQIGSRIELFESQLASSCNVAIYGSGFYGTFIATCLKNKEVINCFLDRNSFRHNKKIFGKKIKDPEQLPDEIDTIFVGLNPAIARENIDMMTSWKNRNLNFFYL